MIKVLKSIRMIMNLGISFQRTGQVILLAITCALTACEKPKLRSDASKEMVESVPEGTPADSFTSASKAPAPPVATTGPGTSVAPSSSPGADQQVAPPAATALDPAARAKEYSRLQRMLDAQLAGIRSLESDFSRHSASLNELNGKLNLARARHAGAGRGGIRVERLGGESTIVDHKAAIRDLEIKIKAEEPLVVQLSASLQRARQQYADLERQRDQLFVE